MTKLTMLGTGHAMVTRCYNTCFLIKNDLGAVMVDCGGGNGILSQMERAGESWDDVRAIYITHAHTDHILGVAWAVRALGRVFRENPDRVVTIYGHSQSIEFIRTMLITTLSFEDAEYDFDGGRLRLAVVEDGDTFTECGMTFTAFDLGSTHKRQFGLKCEYRPGEWLVCLGDEKYNGSCREYAEGADYLMHEAFYPEDRPSPRPVHHSSAANAGRSAAALHAKNLIIYHTEDGDLKNRREKYTNNAREAFSGGIFVPDDLETVEL